MTKLTVSLVAVLALTVAGCGAAAEQNDYVDAVNAEQNQLLDDVSAVVSGPVPTTSAEAAEVAHKLSVAFGDAADQMESISAPDDVASLHAQLVAGLRRLSERLDKAQQALTGSSAQEAAAAAADLQQQISHAQEKINGLIDRINTAFQS